MIINALNSGANVFMADFEDSNSPTWHNLIDGQLNLRDAVDGTISFTSPEGKQYRLNAKTATLMVRPRGWHLPEKHVLLDGKPMPASLFDFGALLLPQRPEAAGQGQRARISTCPSWKATSRPGCGTTCSMMAQDELDIPARQHPRHGADRDDPGRLRDGRDPLRAARPLGRAELRPVGLHLQHHQEVPRASRVHHARPRPGHHDHALHAVLLAAGDQDLPSPRHPRHRRHGRADSRSRTIPQANEEALEKVRADKVREAGDGHDGTWVAHPGLVALAKEAFDAKMPAAQPDRPPPRRRARHRQGPAHRARRARSPSAGCATTSTSASSTWRPG